MRRLKTVSRLVALRKSLDLYHHEDFFTRLTQLGLLKPSSRVQWFLPDGTTPMERDWFDLAVRSFTMRLLSNSEVDVCIVVNGVAENRQFKLPSDSEWATKWCSAEINGYRPGHGTHIEEHLNAEDSAWTQHVPDANETVRRLVEEVAASKSEVLADNSATGPASIPIKSSAAGQNDVAKTSKTSAVDAKDTTEPSNAKSETAPSDANVWTMPALSITLMKQI